MFLFWQKRPGKFVLRYSKRKKNAFLDYKDYRLKQLQKHRLKKVEKLGFVYCPLNLSIVLVKVF